MTNENQYLVRRSFIAPEPNEVLLLADYKQQEMMVMLDQSEEMSIINRLKSGEFSDFYVATAAVVKEASGLELTRQVAKGVALGLAYGQGLDLLAANLGCSRNEAKKIKAGVFSALRKLKILDENLKRQAKSRGYVVNPFGRVTYINKDKDYTALNSFVQGTSADITKTAWVNCGRRLRKDGFKTQVVLCVHDELIFRCVQDELLDVKPVIEEEMIAAYPGKHLSLGVDFEIAWKNKHGVSSWGEKVKYTG